MAGSITISNTFNAQAGPIPLSQLDTNFGQFVTVVNDAATYSNYFADTGLVNAMVVTISSPQTFAYTAGVSLDVKVGVTNTGATTINVNGLGTKNVTTASLLSLSAGILLANGIATLKYDGTQFQLQAIQNSGYLGLPLSSNTTLALLDRGKSIQATSTITVPNAVFSGGDVVLVYNNTAAPITLTATITTMRLAGTATTGNRTIAQRGWATIYFVSGTECSVAGPGTT